MTVPLTIGSEPRYYHLVCLFRARSSAACYWNSSGLDQRRTSKSAAIIICPRFRPDRIDYIYYSVAYLRSFIRCIVLHSVVAWKNSFFRSIRKIIRFLRYIYKKYRSTDFLKLFFIITNSYVFFVRWTNFRRFKFQFRVDNMAEFWIIRIDYSIQTIHYTYFLYRVQSCTVKRSERWFRDANMLIPGLVLTYHELWERVHDAGEIGSSRIFFPAWARPSQSESCWIEIFRSAIGTDRNGATQLTTDPVNWIDLTVCQFPTYASDYVFNTIEREFSFHPEPNRDFLDTYRYFKNVLKEEIKEGVFREFYSIESPRPSIVLLPSKIIDRFSIVHDLMKYKWQMRMITKILPQQSDFHSTVLYL